jgi:RHH-type transcriptional regulator, rel operon repressor / antitoxin RelB
MSQITARLPDETIAALDRAANSLRRTRAEIVRQAIELYLEDYADLSAAIDALRDPSDEVRDWEEVRSALLNSD